MLLGSIFLASLVLCIQGWSEENALHECITSRNMTEFKRILNSGNVDVNAKDNIGVTPLMHAALTRSFDMVGLLLEAGADQNIQDNEGMTPLMFSAKIRNPVLNDMLVKNGDANGALQDNKGETALMKLLSPPDDDQPQNRLIIAGALLGSILANMFTTFGGLAIEGGISLGMKPKLKRSVWDFKGLDVQNLKGETALMYAVRLGDIEPVKQLLDAGASIDIKDNNGNTALQIAVKEGFDNVAKLLVDEGACEFDDCDKLLLN